MLLKEISLLTFIATIFCDERLSFLPVGRSDRNKYNFGKRCVELHVALWSNRSASDSISEGYVFKSRRGLMLYFC